MKKILIVILIVFAGCGPATQITGSWKNPKPSRKRFNTIMVAALTQDLSARQTVESDLVEALTSSSIKTLKSIDAIQPGFLDEKNIDKEELLSKIRKTKVEGILTVSLLNKETENRYVPGTYSYAPVTRYGYYGRFSGYYTTWYPTLTSPGYYVEDEVYFIETNLYDAASEDLIWSAQSQTYDPNGLTQFSKDFAEVVVIKMKQDGVLK
jgi:hypothetical protein